MADSIAEQSTVYVVDDDPSVRKALERLLRSVGYRVGCFSSALDFLDRAPFPGPCCLVLDVNMPGLDGFQLQERLATHEQGLEIIFITGFGTIPGSVKALKAGARDFLQKPFDDGEILSAVAQALAISQNKIKEKTKLNQLRQRFTNLTPREKDVLIRVVSGKLNKQIAAELGVVEKTIKVHRAHVMEKMGVTTLADLVRVAGKLQAYLDQGPPE